MNPIEAVGSFFGNYFNFSKRATRSEFWWSQLFVGLASCIPPIFLIIGLLMMLAGDPQLGLVFLIVGLVAYVAILAMIIPTMAVSVRRLHDTNRSGWLYLLSGVPFGVIVLLIFYVQPSSVGENNYGPQS
jgi:uncharacterized membrane protein YhaH (DUF805 family)